MYFRPRLPSRTDVYTWWCALSTGRADGRSKPAIPSKDANAHPPHVQELGQVGTSMMASNAIGRRSDDNKLCRTIKDAQIQRRRRGVQVDRISAKLKDVEQKFEGTHGRRPPENSLCYTLYLIVALLLVPAETEFNATTFSSVSSTEYGLWVLAGALSIVLVGIAHFVGVFARRKLWVPCGILLTIMPATMCGVAWFRGQYLFIKLQHHVGHHQLVPDPTKATFAFFAINLALFAFNAAYSYWRHEDLLGDVFDLRRQLRGAEAAEERAERREASARVDRAGLAAELLLACELFAASVRRLSFAYFGSNLRARQDRADFGDTGYPTSFLTDVVVLEPNGLASFDTTTDMNQFVSTPSHERKSIDENASKRPIQDHHIIFDGYCGNHGIERGLRRVAANGTGESCRRGPRRFRKYG